MTRCWKLDFASIPVHRMGGWWLSAAKPQEPHPGAPLRFAPVTLAIVVGILIAGASNALANGWAMNSEQVEELMTASYRKMPTETLARHLAHPNGHAGWFVIKTLAERGDEAMPLLEKLVTDTHPLVRQGAMAALIEIRKIDQGDAPQDTPETRRLIGQMKTLVDDPNLAASIVGFLKDAKIDNADVREIALRLAQSSDLALRGAALDMARGFLKDPDTVVKIGMYASAGPKNIPRSWGTAHGLIARYKDQEVSRQAIATVARFQRDTANTLPVRGMFSDGPQIHATALLIAQWDAEVQKMPEVVPAVCRTYVRAPYSLHPGWVTLREQAGKLVLLLDRDAVPAIRATLAEEKQWLAELSADDVVAATFGLKKAEDRKRCEDFIEYLQYLADTLEANQPVTRPPPGPPVEPKQYDDRVPDIEDLDLEGLID